MPQSININWCYEQTAQTGPWHIAQFHSIGYAQTLTHVKLAQNLDGTLVFKTLMFPGFGREQTPQTSFFFQFQQIS